jgi:hypothetical protein
MGALRTLMFHLKGVTDSPRALQAQLARRGYTELVSYQPESRFWHFQLIEGGWLLALALLLGAATVWLVRRKAA